MEAFQERVIDERNQLLDKIQKLRNFNAGHVFKSLPEAERGRLTRQMMAMTTYLGILNERISAFGG